MKNLSVCLRDKGKTSFLYTQEKMQLFLKYFLQTLHFFAFVLIISVFSVIIFFESAKA